jgi:hypothetical protein
MSFARVRALIVVGVLAVAAIVIVVVALVKDTQGDATTGQNCPPGSPLADMQLPDDPAEVTVRVINGTGTQGLADAVTNDFKNRRFGVQKPSESKAKYKGTAQLKFGPDGVGKAQLLRAYFLNNSENVYDPKRKGDAIDIVIGQKYRSLATTTEVNQSLVEIGMPTLPPGACVKPVKKKDDKS